MPVLVAQVRKRDKGRDKVLVKKHGELLPSLAMPTSQALDPPTGQ